MWLSLYYCLLVFTKLMSKVLTPGAGREVLPHNMADDIYTRPHAIHVYLRMRGTVNWWAGWSILPFY